MSPAKRYGNLRRAARRREPALDDDRSWLAIPPRLS